MRKLEGADSTVSIRRNGRLKHLVTIPASCLLLLSTTSCSLLSKSEVQEVKAFAKATKAYGTLPGSAIKAYGDISRNDRELAASSRQFTSGKVAEQVRKHLEEARRSDSAFEAAAAKADKALDILNTYADCLSALASDTYTDELGQSATNLGKSLDDAVKSYNNSFGANLGTIGSLIAGTVRATGGLYIRHEQRKYLQQFVGAADSKIVPKLTRDVANLMQAKVKPNLLLLKDRLDQDFDIAATQGNRLPLATIQSIDAWYDDLAKAQQLADAATNSAKTYRVAHFKLAGTFTSRPTLSRAIEEIETLITEIQAGQKIKDSIKTK